MGIVSLYFALVCCLIASTTVVARAAVQCEKSNFCRCKGSNFTIKLSDYFDFP